MTYASDGLWDGAGEYLGRPSPAVCKSWSALVDWAHTKGSTKQTSILETVHGVVIEIRADTCADDLVDPVKDEAKRYSAGLNRVIRCPLCWH